MTLKTQLMGMKLLSQPRQEYIDTIFSSQGRRVSLPGKSSPREQGLWRGSRSSDSPQRKCPSMVAEAGAWRVVTVTTVDTLSFRVLRALGEGLCSFPYF